MKTMNYLFLMTLLIFGNSCTNYSPWGEKGSDEKSENYYLELDFHQLALKNEKEYLQGQLVVIESEMEGGNEENQGQLDEILMRIAVIEENIALNEEFLSNRPGIPGGGLPDICTIDPEEFRPCPIPRGVLENLLLFTQEWENEKNAIQFEDCDGNVVGEMVGMEPMPETEGQFSKAYFEYDEESACSIVISKLNPRGELTSTSYPLD